MINERMDEYPLHVHGDPVLFDIGFLKGGKGNTYRNTVKLGSLSSFKQCLKVTSSAIFINISANVMFCNYIILNFYNPILR